VWFMVNTHPKEKRAVYQPTGDEYMINRHFHLPAIYYSLTVLLISTVVLVACNGSESSSGYKTLTVKNRIASFSCEYRAYYNDLDGPGIVDSAAHRFTSVHILAPKKYMKEPNPELGKGGTVKMDYIPVSIGIIAADASKYSTMPATVRIEELLLDEARWPHFKLLERTSVTVLDVHAELIAYEVDGFFVGPPMEYHAQISFDRDGLQWDIDAEADIDMAEVVRADFDHVVATLKILE